MSPRIHYINNDISGSVSTSPYIPAVQYPLEAYVMYVHSYIQTSYVYCLCTIYYCVSSSFTRSNISTKTSGSSAPSTTNLPLMV